MAVAQSDNGALSSSYLELENKNPYYAIDLLSYSTQIPNTLFGVSTPRNINY